MFCLEYLALVDSTKKGFGKCMSKLSSPTLLPSLVPSPRALPLPAVPPGPCCCWGVTPCLLFWCLHGISNYVPDAVPVSHICLETPRAAAEQFPQQSSKLLYFFNPPQKPRNHYQLTQPLASVPKAEVQGVQAKSLQLEGIVLLFILEAQMQLILVFSLLVSPVPRNEILALCI